MTDHDDAFPDLDPDDAAGSPPDDKAEAGGVEPTIYDPPPEIPWRIGLFLLLAVLVVVFAVQNTQNAELQFLGWGWELPLVIIILATVVVSVLLDEILGAVIKRRRRGRQLEREELRRLRDKS